MLTNYKKHGARAENCEKLQLMFKLSSLNEKKFFSLTTWLMVLNLPNVLIGDFKLVFFRKIREIKVPI